MGDALESRGSAGHGCIRFAGALGGGGGGVGANIGFVPVAQEVSTEIKIAPGRIRDDSPRQALVELLCQRADGVAVIFSPP